MKSSRVVGLFAASAVVLGAIITGVSSIYVAKMDHPDPPKVGITFKRVVPLGHHKGVSVKDGYAAGGSAINLPNLDSLWLMDRDDTTYTIDQRAIVSGGTWTAVSFPVGDSGQKLPFGLTAAIVRASSACYGILQLSVQQGKDTLDGLPEGCTEMASHSVTVTEP